MTNMVRAIGCVIVAMLAMASTVRGHETDQFTLPAGRDFADLGNHLTNWAYLTIERGVEKTNRRIQTAVQAKRSREYIQELQSNETLVRAVNGEFADAYSVIEGMESLFKSKSMKQRHPGKIVGFEKQFGNIYQHVHFPLDPRQFFRIWHASTFIAFDTYLGTDKVGHFTDMGMHYYRAYIKARKAGLSEEQAMAKAVEVGTHGPIFSERGMVGYLSAGAYGNADLAANYLGFLFYRNLTDPMKLKGITRPPMVERDGEYWRIAPHVRLNSDFFSAFISDHLNEVFNPSHYEAGMRDEIRRALRERTDLILSRHADAQGNRRPREHFDPIARGMETYYGQEYGYVGPPDEMVTVANSCFEDFAPDAPHHERNRSGFTPLHWAAERGDLKTVKRLIQRGADVNARVQSEEDYSSEWGNTPLHYAAARGDARIIDFLLDSYADVNARDDRGQTPLHRAVGHVDAMAALIESLAAIDAADSRGRTPLHWAAMGGQVQSVAVLLGKGADPNARDNNGQTPLHAAVRAGSSLIASALVDHGAYVNAIDRLDVTPLHMAAALNDQALIERLAAAGGDVHAKDQFGWSALHEAAWHGSQEAVSQLVELGALVNDRAARACTPLHLAARGGHTPVIELLVEQGGVVNVQNDIGATPLHEAAFGGKKPAVELLLALGCDAGSKTVSGQSAFDIAKARQFREIAAMLSNGHIAVGAR